SCSLHSFHAHAISLTDQHPLKALEALVDSHCLLLVLPLARTPRALRHTPTQITLRTLRRTSYGYCRFDTKRSRSTLSLVLMADLTAAAHNDRRAPLPVDRRVGTGHTVSAASWRW